MFSFLGAQQTTRTSIFQLAARVRCGRRLGLHDVTPVGTVRFASRSNQSSRKLPNVKPRYSSDRRRTNSDLQSRPVDAAKKASLLLNSLSKIGRDHEIAGVQRPLVEDGKTLPATVNNANSESEEDCKTIEIDKQEEAIQRRIVHERTKLLWPGIWTFVALTGTIGTFAYLDARYSTPSDTTQLPERAQLPQTWFLTPEVIKEGVKAGWKELDKLTIGIVVATVAIHFMKKSPLPFWEKLIHITGEKRYTAFTYPFAHSNWAHLSQNMFALCWFMPGVVRYLDGDMFQAAALFASVPLLTSYLQHFTFRWGAATGIPLNMGSSGAVAALLGAYCAAYPNEKVWLPSFAIVRLDAMYWGVLFAIWQLGSISKTPKGGNRPAFLVSHSRQITSACMLTSKGARRQSGSWSCIRPSRRQRQRLETIDRRLLEAE
jgi:membrane associated rhomboid family serine protease